MANRLDVAQAGPRHLDQRAETVLTTHIVGKAFPGRAPIIYTAFGGNGSPGIDRVRWLIAIAVAAVLVIIASAITARSRSRAL